jgi:hypothetical protein
VTSEHAKNICRIKIAEQVKLCSAILCKTMQDQKEAKKDELKNAQNRSSYGYWASHLVILLLIFDDLEAAPSLKQLTSVIL